MEEVLEEEQERRIQEYGAQQLLQLREVLLQGEETAQAYWNGQDTGNV